MFADIFLNPIYKILVSLYKCRELMQDDDSLV